MALGLALAALGAVLILAVGALAWHAGRRAIRVYAERGRGGLERARGTGERVH